MQMTNSIKKIIPLLIILFISCKTSIDNNETSKSYLFLKEGDFKTKNLTSFYFDTAFLNSYYDRTFIYKDFTKSKSPFLDSVLETKHYYLYSLQQYDKKYKSLTVATEEMGESLEMSYLVFDQQDSLISKFRVAKNGTEPGGHKYSTKSTFISIDTLVVTSERTFLYDQITLNLLSKPIGDTAISKYKLQNGQFILITTDTIFHTKKYLDKEGFITQKTLDKKHYR
jgi:hypothetical protein